MRKILLSIGVLVLIGALSFLFWFSQNRESYSISSIWTNETTGMALTENDEIAIGDILERSIFVKNTGKTTISNLTVSETNPFSGAEESFALDSLLPHETKRVSYRTGVDQSVNGKVTTTLKSTGKKETDMTETITVRTVKRKRPIPLWEVTTVSPATIQPNFDSFVSITGKNLDAVEEVVFSCDKHEVFVPISLHDSGKLLLNLPANTVSGKSCDILFQASKILFPTGKTIGVKTFEESGPIAVFDIVPNRGTAGKELLSVVQGKGFAKLKAVQISNGLLLDASQIQVISDNAIAVRIPATLAAGTYSLRFLHADGVFDAKNHTFTVVSSQ